MRTVAFAIVLVGCGLTLDFDSLKGNQGDAGPDVIDAAEEKADAPTPDVSLPPTQPLFYLDLTKEGDAAPSATPMVAYPNGDAAPQAIGCPADVTSLFDSCVLRTGSLVGAGGYPPLLAINRAFYPSSPQPPPGDSLFVFAGGGTVTGSLLAADELSTCGSAKRLDPFDAGLQAFAFPRFRSDGKRIAYIAWQDINASDKALYTAAPDGAGGPRLIYRGSDIGDTPPAWLEDTQLSQVMWTASDGTIFAQPDGPAPKVAVAKCNLPIVELDYLRDPPFQRLVLQLARRIYVLDFNEDCSNRVPLVNEPTNVVQQDFAISPDKKWIAYVSNRDEVSDASTQSTHVWTVRSEGGSPIPCGPRASSWDDVAPRWFAGGKQLVFNRIHRPGATSPSAIMIADVGPNGACSNVRPVVEGKSDKTRTQIVYGSSNSGCASGGAGGRDWPLALVALFGLARRRQRNT